MPGLFAEIEPSPTVEHPRRGVRAEVELIRGDCLEVMRGMDDSSVDLIATDPPYFKVKRDAWDRQWDKPDRFLSWIGELCDEWQRILKPNGSLYCFASPQMAWGVEGEIRRRFSVLSNVRWSKDAGWHKKTRPTDLRSYLSPWESVIFAEHFNADNMAKGEAGYAAKCDELRGFVFEPLRAYICGEFERAGMLNTDGKIAANVACGFSPSSGGMASRHYFGRSQWCLPTREHYHAMRDLLNSSNCRRDYLRREYEDLRREYEHLRREYEHLRRPFSVTADVPYTDVWTFPTVQAYKGKHPCEKPLAMMEHIARASSREGATVLDCFVGSGTTGVACVNLNRNFIGIEKDAEYYEVARERIAKAAAGR